MISELNVYQIANKHQINTINHINALIYVFQTMESHYQAITVVMTACML